jgi:hypothetical protein
VWAFAASGWLVIMGMTQLGLHVWGVVQEHAMQGQREFAMEAMRQAFFPEPLQPSLWRRYRMLSASLGLFYLFAGIVPGLLAWLQADRRVLAGMALFGTVFWTLTFMPYAFSDPVALPLATAAVAVPLHGTMWLTATLQVLQEETRP